VTTTTTTLAATAKTGSSCSCSDEHVHAISGRLCAAVAAEGEDGRSRCHAWPCRLQRTAPCGSGLSRPSSRDASTGLRLPKRESEVSIPAVRPRTELHFRHSTGAHCSVSRLPAPHRTAYCPLVTIMADYQQAHHFNKGRSNYILLVPCPWSITGFRWQLILLVLVLPCPPNSYSSRLYNRDVQCATSSRRRQHVQSQKVRDEDVPDCYTGRSEDSGHSHTDSDGYATLVTVTLMYRTHGQSL
jgi:hypothetical protein